MLHTLSPISTSGRFYYTCSRPPQYQGDSISDSPQYPGDSLYRQLPTSLSGRFFHTRHRPQHPADCITQAWAHTHLNVRKILSTRQSPTPVSGRVSYTRSHPPQYPGDVWKTKISLVPVILSEATFSKRSRSTGRRDQSKNLEIRTLSENAWLIFSDFLKWIPKWQVARTPITPLGITHQVSKPAWRLPAASL